MHASAGSVPRMKYSCSRSRHRGVARSPVDGSISTWGTPSGGGNSSPRKGSITAARFMKSAHMGSADWDPERFNSLLSSNPTQTMQSKSGV